MGRAVLTACVPWLGWLLASFLVLMLLMRASRVRPELRRLRQLHADQDGSAQSLSFVLTLPLFVMILLFIVQVSQLMIGQIVVEYAAYAAARAAAVWIPAEVAGGTEPANCINGRQAFPFTGLVGPAAGGVPLSITSGSPKYAKILSAAAMACMPISPSRNLDASLSSQGAAAAEIIKTAYAALAPDSTTNSAIAGRIENKLAYAMANTSVELSVYHPNSEPPLVVPNYGWGLPEDTAEFRPNEIGWQDQITVTVRHNLALLPGPGRLLAKWGVLGVSGTQGNTANVYRDVYTYPLHAAAVIGNEGEKSLIPYVYQTF